MKKFYLLLLLIFAINPAFVQAQNFATVNFFEEKLQKEFLQKIAIQQNIKTSTIKEEKIVNTSAFSGVILEEKNEEEKKSDYTILQSDTEEKLEKILTDINSRRIDNNLQKFSNNIVLQKIALKKAEHMAENQYVGHWSPDGKNLFSIMSDFEKTFFVVLGENVASGYNTTIDSLYQSLLSSPLHYNAMLSARWKQYGSAIVKKD